jgi:hypothetical protein
MLKLAFMSPIVIPDAYVFSSDLTGLLGMY